MLILPKLEARKVPSNLCSKVRRVDNEVVLDHEQRTFAIAKTPEQPLPRGRQPLSISKAFLRYSLPAAPAREASIVGTGEQCGRGAQ
jgi:hypothetical protein